MLAVVSAFGGASRSSCPRSASLRPTGAAVRLGGSGAARRNGEPVPRLREGALGERKYLGRVHREDENRAGPALVPEGAVVDRVVPAPVPLHRPRLCKTLENASSVTWTASPSTTTSSPRSPPLQPVVRITCRLALRFTAFCSPGPVAKWIASSSHTATRGVTCGRPSARTVEIQNSSASSRAIRVSSQLVATA